jgi:hypothetical protein
MKRKYSIKKYNGDDRYSHAIFYAEDVKGMRSPIFLGQARPIISGLDLYEARSRKKRLESQT